MLWAAGLNLDDLSGTVPKKDKPGKAEKPKADKKWLAHGAAQR